MKMSEIKFKSNQQTYVNELKRHLWSDVNALRQAVTSLRALSFHQQLRCFLAVQRSTPGHSTWQTWHAIYEISYDNLMIILQ